MKIKIQIKNRFTSSVIFEYEKEENTIKETVKEAIKSMANLSMANLSGADLSGANLSGANLYGADLYGKKIKKYASLNGLYKYHVLAYITECGEVRIKMGCYDRLLTEWESDFWNNPVEFPNNGEETSELRLFAFETAKNWINKFTK